MKRPTLAHALPFLLFVGGLGAVSALRALGVRGLDPMYWIYPVQTVLCAGALLFFRRDYDFGGVTAGRLLAGAAVGGLVWLLWVSPQELFHQAARREGFDPGVVPGLEGWMTAARFARLVVVVPLVEEIFWRGFLLRYLVREDFTSLPFGSCSRWSFWAVVGAFTLVHDPADWPAAFLTGILFNLVAVRTRSLAACVVAHAVANLALGLYIMATRQWGFW
jgi:CAAX prenyl protease-like protein